MKKQNQSFVSIIMPIYNEASFIESSITSVVSQDYPKEQMEVLIADGMSTDGTKEIVQFLQKKHPNIKIIDNPGKIVPIGINAALRQAKGEIIIRVDGHTIIENDYVSQCVSLLQKNIADNVGGKMNARGTNLFGRVVAIATSSPFGVGGARFHYSEQEEYVDTVYMGAWKREVFSQIGLFDEELVRNQDDEFNYRLRAVGGRILLSPKIRSTYTNRSTPKSLGRQYYQYGFWKVRVLQKHPKQMSLRQFVPPVFVFSLLASFLLVFTSSFPVPLMAISMLYIFVNLSVSVYIVYKHGWKYFLYLPITFAILHLSYGFGFLVGLIQFWNRWTDKVGNTPIWSIE